MDRDPPRTEGILISGHDPAWAVGICWLLGCASLLMGGLLAFRGPSPPAILLLALGFCLTLGGLVLAVVLRQRRRYLIPTDDGFIYITSYGEREFQDEDVMCVSLSQQSNYFWGSLQTVTRRFIIWVETSAAPERIVCISHRKPYAPDPLQEFVSRIISELHAAAKLAHRHGERVDGDGWALERNQLLLKSPRSTSVIAIEDLSAIETVDDHINIWRKGQDLPIGRIPEQTANAHILVLMLNELMAEHAPESEASLPPGHLGRMIFERRLGSRTTSILGWALVSLLALLAVLMTIGAVFNPRPRRQMRMAVAAVILGSMSALGSSLLAFQSRARFRRHAFGVHQRGMFTDRRLRYSEIANLSSAAIKRYSHGIYNGTTLTLRFVPMPGLNLKPISYSAHIHHIDTEIDRLRDEIAAEIADRMRDFWSQHGNCPWVPYLQFQGEGLSYNRLTFTGRKQPILIPFDSIVNFNISDGTFRIWTAGQSAPIVNEETSQPNFYPGLVLFSTLMQREAAVEQ